MSTVIKTRVDTDHELASNTYIPGLIAYIDRAFSLLTALFKIDVNQ